MEQHRMKSEFLSFFAHSITAQTLQKCTLSRPTAQSPTDLQNIYGRLVSLKKGLHVSFNHRYATRDEVKNLLPEAAIAQMEAWLGKEFLQADLFLEDKRYVFSLNKKGEAHLKTFESRQINPKTLNLQHDRAKQRLLTPDLPWLHALGITSAKGQIHHSEQDKWRQINKFAETIEGLLKQNPMPPDAQVADMGSGKGYLTFALYEVLRRHVGEGLVVTGVELRPDLVDICNHVAAANGYTGLRFVASNIGAYASARLDMLIALHACDTATDLAIAQGVKAGAKLIVVAPCCHKQVRRDMQPENALKPVLNYGILAERQAELLTDGLRALLLEAEGYKTQVFEFISTEHTPKNVMITAVQVPQGREARRQAALTQVNALKADFGLPQHYLEQLL